MIDKNILFLDMDYIGWNNLSKIYSFLAPYRKTLFVLLENGHILNIADSDNTSYSADYFNIQKSSESAERIFEETESIDRIVVMERKAYIRFYCKAHSELSPDLDSDTYNIFVNSLFEDDPDISFFYRSGKKKQFFTLLQTAAAENLPENCILFLGITEQKTLIFHCIIRFVNRKIVLLTSLDMFNIDHFHVPRQGNEISNIIKTRFTEEIKFEYISLEDLKKFCQQI